MFQLHNRACQILAENVSPSAGKRDTITIYSGEKIGDAIWQDEDNLCIQLLKKAS